MNKRCILFVFCILMCLTVLISCADKEKVDGNLTSETVVTTESVLTTAPAGPTAATAILFIYGLLQYLFAAYPVAEVICAKTIPIHPLASSLSTKSHFSNIPSLLSVINRTLSFTSIICSFFAKNRLDSDKQTTRGRRSEIHAL